jgi:hypothetical protein
MEPRLKGHSMHPGAGGAYAYALRAQTRGRKAQTRGAAYCQCGAYSPILPSIIDRVAWHQKHVADVIAGKTALL